MPKHKPTHLQKILSLKGNGGTAPSLALPFQQEQKGSNSESGPCNAGPQENLGSSLTQESDWRTCNSSDNSSSHHREKIQNATFNPRDILGGIDDPQRPLHIVWPHRWKKERKKQRLCRKMMTSK